MFDNTTIFAVISPISIIISTVICCSGMKGMDYWLNKIPYKYLDSKSKGNQAGFIFLSWIMSVLTMSILVFGTVSVGLYKLAEFGVTLL